MVNCWGRDIDLDNAWLVCEEVQTDEVQIEAELREQVAQLQSQL